MQIQQFLTSLGTTVAKEAGGKVGKWIVDSIASRIKKAKLFSEDDIKKTEKTLNEFVLKGKKTGLSLVQNFWIDFLTFMFPEREVTIDKLDSTLCDYIANRIYTGLGFEKLLLDAEYKMERIHYMVHFQGQQSLTPYYFDLAAAYEQEYFDNIIIARVIDVNVSSPQDFVNSLPTVVRDINGDLLARPAFLRDHDMISVIISNDLTTRQLTRLRQTIRTVQMSNPIILPRLILFTNEELTSLLACDKKEERRQRFLEKFHEVRPYRGIE
jgi:hypothetical protein